MTTPFRFGAPRQRGAGIVETMVGILIGMIVVLVIYNVFALAEGYKRTAIGAADAQTTGRYAQFVLAREIANAGGGISGAARDLSTCTAPDPAWANPPAFQPPAVPPVRPIPVLIADSGNPNTSDSFIVTYSTAPRVVSPVLFVDAPMVAATDPFYVQSPNGFQANDRVIAIDETGNCEVSTVTAVVPGDSKGDVTTGIVTVSHPPTANLYKSSSQATLLNLGQAGAATRSLYDVFNAQLRSTDLLTPGATANPFAQNVVLMKLQYGVDCLNNGVVTWTTATASNICGDGVNYTPTDLANPAMHNGATLARIRAIRVGIVVRSDEPDLKDASLTGQTAVLFDCSTHDAACQGRTIIDTVLTDYYRFRTYETVVPMRNAIWNNGT